MAAVTICSDFGAQENLSLFPLFLHLFAMEWWDWMILVFWMLSFKPGFSLSSFTFIKRLFSSSSLSVKRVVSSAYLRLLIFPPAILIPACASCSLAKYYIYPIAVRNLSFPTFLCPLTECYLHVWRLWFYV